MVRFEAGPIERFSWGKFIIRGKEHSEGDERVGKGKDICLIGEEVSRWKERKGHRLAPEMLERVYGRGIEVLVIGCGVHRALECPDDVIAAAHQHGVAEVIVKATPEACQEYNRLYNQGRRVALLAHGTC